MLDMAFQLLAFFVLTFRQTPLEGQISLRLPPPQATVVVKGGEAAGSDVNNKNPLQGMNTLTISVSADPNSGTINGLRVGESPVTGIAALDGRLQELFRDQGNPFDQIVIQASESCRYDELMKIIDVCTHQTLSDGKKLSKLSLVELPSG
jgi:biopolymer transport protein ExbD